MPETPNTPNSGNSNAQNSPNAASPAKAAPAGGPRVEAADPQHMDAFQRAKARKGSGAATAPASDSPAAGLSTGKTAIQKERGLNKPGKSAMDVLREKSRNFNPNVAPIKNEIEIEDPSGGGEAEELEVEPLAPAPGEAEVPEEESSANAVTQMVGDHTPGEGVEPTEVEAPEEGAFTPSFKYKAFGKEHDIPEIFKGVITNPESEREVQQVLERAHAMDRFKTNLTQLDTMVKEQIAPEIQFHRKTRQEFNELLNRGDIMGVLRKMNVSEEKFLQAAAERATIRTLPPEQRAQYEAREQAEAQRTQAANQVQQLQEQVQNMQASAKSYAIQSTFARGDVRAVADEFDGRVGQPGAFEKMVRDHGALLYSQGTDITPEQAVSAVMQRYGLQVPTGGNAAGSPQVTTPVGSRAAPQAPARPPAKVLPNITSRAAATVRSKPTINNVEDLRKLRAQTRGR